ncbi:hypothetical protein L1887_48823 [Cichorium endivia]|nr:hypothetical protein L1887_48823 [Cichorium endivia]
MVWVWWDGCVSLDGRRNLHRGRGARERVASGETEQLFARVRDPRCTSRRGPIHRRHRVRRGLRTNGDTRRHCNNAYKDQNGDWREDLNGGRRTRWVGMAILISPPRGCLGRGSGSTIGKSPKSHWTDRCGNSAVEAKRGNHAKTLGVFRDVAAAAAAPALSPYRATSHASHSGAIRIQPTKLSAHAILSRHHAMPASLVRTGQPPPPFTQCPNVAHHSPGMGTR